MKNLIEAQIMANNFTVQISFSSEGAPYCELITEVESLDLRPGQVAEYIVADCGYAENCPNEEMVDSELH